MSSQSSSLGTMVSSDPFKISSFNMSMLIGLMVVTISVIIIVGIIMNMWVKHRRSKVMPMIHEEKSKKSILVQYITPPKQAFNSNVKSDYSRKSDTWESYLKMIQTPDKLNNIVRTMKIDHSPSSTIRSKSDKEDVKTKTIENSKVNHDNHSFNHILQRETLLQQEKVHYKFI
uniref:Protein esaA n=1 Tax=Anthurium amnicola TaxID=1678845 RepID=A0A1D1ZIB4_9ARAE